MPCPTSSSSFAYEWTYDVFLSFRGQDTRRGFTGNLFHALCQKGVKTFMDDQELRKGEETTPALMNAIQESRIAILIFSQNYASSAFCLQELVKIMECLKHKGRLVWPIFYKVDPSDVRHQKGSYGEALAKHETRINDKDKLKKWRLALQEASNLSGWHFKQEGYEYEYELIGEITQEVSKKINRIPLYVANYPVGLESRVHKVKSLLDVESNDGVHMVGIYGIGGIGKTTLACAVYSSIADHFQALSFLSDIRETTLNHGLPYLQETLLSDILGEKDIKLGSVRKGIPIIKSRLCKKKILLILDDVNNKDQLEKLAGGLDWFGSGSRIIITTRDVHLLRVHGVERTYEVEGLNHEEALEFFSWNAFKGNEVDPSYLDIAKRVILHSNGHPLSLEIIGSDLYDKTESQWKSALDVYKRIPHEEIQKVLRVSYNGLKEFEKEIFLDIACFFKGYVLRDVINILYSGRGSAPEYAIRVLVDKCLIKIDGSNDYVRMHDLIEDMGREIVRQESPLKPGERSRLWFSEDILHVFKYNKGSDKTEIIILQLPEDKEVQWDGNALKQMENLKILVVKNGNFSRGPSSLPNSLRVLQWPGYPGSLPPADFDPEKLVILDLSRSFFTFENQHNMKLMSLTEMKLSYCELLTEVPDLSGAPSLKKLELDCCKNLVEVHDSVGFLYKLEHLSLSHCTRLRVLPRGLELTSLKTMSLRYCNSLTTFPEILGAMENIEELHLSSSAISCLPYAVGEFEGVVASDPSPGLLGIFKYKSSDKGCYLADKFLAAVVLCLRNVTSLFLNCSNITILPSSISTCLSLTRLSLDECKELREIQGLPPNIKDLSAVNCTSLTFESKEMLMNQRLHENGGTIFNFPGSSIPSWLNYSTKAPSLRFWFRNNVPEFILCVVGVVNGRVTCKMHPIFTCRVWAPNSTPFGRRNYRVKTNHTILCSPVIISTGSKFKKLPIKDIWFSAEISFEENSGITYIEWMGLHVLEHKTSMADIQFTEPEFNVKDYRIFIRFGADIKTLQLSLSCPYKMFSTNNFLIGCKCFTWVRKLCIPEKIRNFLLLILHHSLPTSYHCHKRTKQTTGCDSCSHSREDILHCLRDCPHAREVWIRMGFFSLPGFLTDDVQDWIATQFRSEKCFIFVAILWWIWMWHNNRLFNANHWNIAYVIRNAMLLHDDLVIYSKEPGKFLCSDIPIRRWYAPPLGVYKLNVAGTFCPYSNRIGCGGVLRDHLGAWMVGFSSDGHGDSILAQLMSILHGLEFLWDKGYRNIICEMANFNLVEILRLSIVPPHFKHASLLFSILQLLNRNWFIDLNYIESEANNVANYLADCGFRQHQSWIIWNTPSSRLEYLLSKDKLGLSLSFVVCNNFQ